MAPAEVLQSGSESRFLLKLSKWSGQPHCFEAGLFHCFPLSSRGRGPFGVLGLNHTHALFGIDGNFTNSFDQFELGCHFL
jgi:hypothetical protein